MAMNIIVGSEAWERHHIDEDDPVQITIAPFLEIDEDNLEELEPVPLSLFFDGDEYTKMLSDIWKIQEKESR